MPRTHTGLHEHVAQALEGAPAVGQLLVQSLTRRFQLPLQPLLPLCQSPHAPVRLLCRRLAPHPLQLPLHLFVFD